MNEIKKKNGFAVRIQLDEVVDEQNNGITDISILDLYEKIRFHEIPKTIEKFYKMIKQKYEDLIE